MDIRPVGSLLEHGRVVVYVSRFPKLFSSCACVPSPAGQVDGLLTSPAAECAGKKIPCVFQEPRFSVVDKAFIASLGHTVVESPGAFPLVDDRCLLFGVHLYRKVYKAALVRVLPSVFVGTGFEVWDDCGRGGANFGEMEQMDTQFQMIPFPQDDSFTTFSSTCIYWNLRGAEPEDIPDVLPDDSEAEEEVTG